MGLIGALNAIQEQSIESENRCGLVGDKRIFAPWDSAPKCAHANYLKKERKREHRFSLSN